VRVEEGVAITATGAAFETITAEQVVVVDAGGEVVEGDLAPTSELELHLAVYRGTGAGAVVHTHAPDAVAVGLVTDELPCIHYQMLLLGGSVRVAPYATFGSAELATHVSAALADRTAALMANHGAVTYGSDLQAALDATVLLEWTCGIYLRAAAVGSPRSLDAAQQQAVIEAAVRTRYGTTRPAGEEST
jgi:L-fuculose-phosphate aldolase